MTTEEFLRTYWPIIAGLVAVIVWAVRVEGMVKKAVSEIEALKDQRREDRSATITSREEVHETLAIIQRDIKDILRAMGQRNQQ